MILTHPSSLFRRAMPGEMPDKKAASAFTKVTARQEGREGGTISGLLRAKGAITHQPSGNAVGKPTRPIFEPCKGETPSCCGKDRAEGGKPKPEIPEPPKGGTTYADTSLAWSPGFSRFPQFWWTKSNQEC